MGEQESGGGGRREGESKGGEGQAAFASFPSPLILAFILTNAPSALAMLASGSPVSSMAARDTEVRLEKPVYCTEIASPVSLHILRSAAPTGECTGEPTSSTPTSSFSWSVADCNARKVCTGRAG